MQQPLAPAPYPTTPEGWVALRAHTSTHRDGTRQQLMHQLVRQHEVHTCVDVGLHGEVLVVAATEAPAVTQVWGKAPDDSVGQPCHLTAQVVEVLVCFTVLGCDTPTLPGWSFFHTFSYTPHVQPP